MAISYYQGSETYGTCATLGMPSNFYGICRSFYIKYIIDQWFSTFSQKEAIHIQTYIFVRGPH